LDRCPDYAEAWYRLGLVLQTCSRETEAIECFQKAIAVRADFPACQYVLANLLGASGDYDGARTIFAQLLERDTENMDVIAAYAGLFEFEGEKDKALDYLAPWVRVRTPNLALATVYSRCTVEDSTREGAAEYLQDLLDKGGYSDAQERDAFYALGQLYDKLGRWEQAFSSFTRANELEGYEQERDRFEEEFIALTKGFPIVGAGDIRARGVQSDKSLFVVGMPRSGTTLVEQILASHSRIHGAGELDDIGRLISRLKQRCATRGEAYPQGITTLGDDYLNRQALEYLGKLESLAPEAGRVVDKMPHNFLALGVIDLLFPNARVIHCVRDPRDTCLSIHFRHFPVNHAYAADLFELGRYYRHYEELMHHWSRVLKLPILTVAYEDLVDDLEGSARRLIEFSELEWESQCVEFYNSKRVVTTPTYGDVRQPVYKSSVDRWKHYQPYIGRLLDGLSVSRAT